MNQSSGIYLFQVLSPILSPVVSNVNELIPAFTELHPIVRAVLIYNRRNDIMATNSSKLQLDLESLYYTIERLRKCLMSGPIPSILHAYTQL